MPDRIEREIDDLLKKIDNLDSHRKRKSTPPRRPPNGPARPTSLSPSPRLRAWLVLVGIIATVVFLERSGWVAGVLLTLVIIGLIVAGAYLAREWTTQTRPQYEKRWRGQALDLRLSGERKGWRWFRRG